MEIRKKMRPLIVIGLILVLLISNAEAIGLGVVPSKLSIADALRGEEYEQMIVVHNTDVMTTTFRPYATGEIRGWIEFYDEDGNKLTKVMIPGKDSAKILLKFKIPDDAASGNYNSTVYVENVPGAAAGEGVGAQMLIRMPVDITIRVTGEQILEGAVHGVTLMNTEIEHPLRIEVMFKNTGNVVAKPVINVEIGEEGTVINSFSAADKAVKPHTMEKISVEWNTRGQAVGDYVADVRVSLEGNVLYEREFPFKILEKGELTRKGILSALSYEGEPVSGEIIKVLATFENMGKIETKAKFTGEVHRDGKLIEVIESDELEIPVRKTGTLTSYFKLDEPGDYNISGYAVYEGKKTNTKDILLKVPEEKEEREKEKEKVALTPITPIVIGMGVAGAITAVLIVVFLRKIRWKCKK